MLITVPLKRIALAASLLALPVLLSSTPARAQTAAATITGPANVAAEDSLYTHGFKFTPLTDITVTDLGYWDFNNDGLLADHNVGIWNDATNALLSSAVIPAGTGPTLLNGFRYVSVTPFVLQAGQTYVAGGRSATGTNDGLAAQTPGNVAFDPALSTVSKSGYFETSPGLNKPAQQSGSYDAYLGPNFLIGGGQGAAAPEPGAGVLALCGLAAAAREIVRRRRSA